MMTIKAYKGGGNTARIEKYHNHPAFKGDTVKADIFRVVFSADYDNNFVYHVTCFETQEEAEAHVAEYPFFKPFMEA